MLVEIGFYMGMIMVGFVCGSVLVVWGVCCYVLVMMILGGWVVVCVGLLIGFVLVFGGVMYVFVWFGLCVLVGIGNGLSNLGVYVGVVLVCLELVGSVLGLVGVMMIGGGVVLLLLMGVLLIVGNVGYLLFVMMLLLVVIVLVVVVCVWVFDG